MRNLDERMAEINRRSEKLIKARKQRRKHILLTCIPLVLCVGLFTAVALPEMTSHSTAMDSAVGTQAVNDQFANTNTGTAMTVKSVTVSGAGTTQVISEPAAVQQIGAQIDNCYLELKETAITGGTSNGNAGEAATENPADNKGTVTNMTEYTITLVIHDGSTAEYSLVGNSLKNRSTGQICTLKKDQLIQLRNLLGIQPY